MNTFSKISGILALALILPFAAAATSSAEDERADVALEDLSWLAGYWSFEEEGNIKVECWLPPQRGVMIGIHQDSYVSGKMFFEYLRIVATAEGLVYYASPRGYETTAFRLTSYTDESGVREVVFENPEKEFPKLIRYTLDEEGVLMAVAEGYDDGFDVVEAWTWYRSEFPK